MGPEAWARRNRKKQSRKVHKSYRIHPIINGRGCGECQVVCEKVHRMDFGGFFFTFQAKSPKMGVLGTFFGTEMLPYMNNYFLIFQNHSTNYQI